MAFPSSSTFHQQFQCSVCLDVFTEPVSTPCGHNFCQGCITGYWAASKVSQCPLCLETFHQTPELRVNTEFRDILEFFKSTRGAAEDSSPPVRSWEVPCDLCSGVKRKAVNSCLVCLVSYCSSHLEPHNQVQALKWHKLISPLKSLEERACNKHNKLKEFFCRNDQSCVCVTCMRDDHVMHDVVSLEEELKERKTQLKHVKANVEHRLKEKTVKAHMIQNSIKQTRQEVEKSKAESIKSFESLVALIETKKLKLIRLLEEKQREAEQQAEVLIRQLELEIAEDRRLSVELEELSNTEDDFRLLQDLPSIPPPSNAQPFTPGHLTLLHADLMRRAVADMKEMLSDQMENIIREVCLMEAEEAQDSQTGHVMDDELGTIQNQYAAEVTLDPYTAHPSLIVSGDKKRVRDGVWKRNVPENSSRFDCLHFVLGNEGFSSGKFYYEVTLRGQKTWEVGVTREDIRRKGADLSLSPESGCWTLGSYWGRCQANTNPPLVLPKKPEKLGVFVDYEGGLVSFYDVDTRAQIYSFTQCIFTVSPNTNFLSGIGRRVYTGKITKTSIYPIFRPSSEEGAAPLQIWSLRGAKRKT
ncbi:E3 ubiquitin-protein ligase TRIM39-like [Melanotaenia boesemani]|uniref:E3 ubiquitin-protein ligase TRIM39-like n=1 Tax=Melanotaenia boesemani TaxID=1250792 RepID=UPI001C0474BB|nr:E3 ubiquitin-protein ligase TRIM39-like [Melanotaenia boesemani]